MRSQANVTPAWAEPNDLESNKNIFAHVSVYTHHTECQQIFHLLNLRLSAGGLSEVLNLVCTLVELPAVNSALSFIIKSPWNKVALFPFLHSWGNDNEKEEQIC